jgi:TusA-related sulfurtransferase
MSTETAVHVDVRLDLKGLSCPGPILGAKKMVDSLAEGQVMLLLSNCPGTQDDLYAWAANTGNRVLRVDRYADGSAGYYVQRGQGARKTANVSLDMRGAICPGPVLEAKKLINGMAAGETLRLISNCPGSRDDVEGWARSTGLELLESVQVGSNEFEFYIRKP